MSNSFVFINDNNELQKLNMNVTSHQTNLTFDNNLLINGNLNFTGEITKDGNPLVSSLWTEDNSNIYYDSGSVGIGTINPSAKLDVNGEIKSNQNITTGISNPYPAYNFGTNSHRIQKEGNNFTFISQGNYMGKFQGPASAPRFGIGTISPSSTLDVNGDINFTGEITKNGNPLVSSVWTEDSTNNISYTAGKVSIGNLVTTSVGNNNTTEKLHIQGNLKIGGAYTYERLTAGNLDIYTNTCDFYVAGGQYQYFHNGSRINVGIGPNSNEQMKFYDNGGSNYFNIAKFTTFPSGYGQWEGLHFPTAQMGSGEHAVIGGFLGEGFWFAQNGDAAGFSNPADYSALTFYDEDGASSTMSASWYISGSGGSINSSDIRIKTEVNTYKNNNYEKYKKIRIVTYKKKIPKNIKPERLTKQSCINKYNDIHYGVIAQELYELYPELETTSGIRELQEWEYRRDNWNNGVYEQEHSEWLEKKTEFENNNKENSTFNVPEPQEIFDEEEPIKSVEYQRINLLTIGIVQDLITEIETLKTENTELKTKLDELTNKIKNATTFEDLKNSL